MKEKAKVDKITFSARLKELMEEHNETVYSLAEIVHLSPATISRYSNAEMAPKITTIEVLANYFNVSPAWLMGYNVPKQMESEDMNKNDKEEILTRAAHAVGHEGPLSEEDMNKIELAIKIALAKHKE